MLRTGSQDESVVQLATRILAHYQTLGELAKASVEDLQREFNGIGPVKAIELKAVFELAVRYHKEQPLERPQIKSPADAARFMMLEMKSLDHEELRTILLDSKNHIIGTPTIYSGSVNSAVVRVGELFKYAIRANCAALIVVHNHPSGDPTPSPEDVAVTRQIVEAGKLLDISVLDHVVIGEQRWVSLKERGLGF